MSTSTTRSSRSGRRGSEAKAGSSLNTPTRSVPSAYLPSTGAAGCVWGALFVLVLGVDLGEIQRPVPGPGLGERQRPGLRAPKARTGSARGVVFQQRIPRVHAGIASRVLALYYRRLSRSLLKGARRWTVRPFPQGSLSPYPISTPISK